MPRRNMQEEVNSRLRDSYTRAVQSRYNYQARRIQSWIYDVITDVVWGCDRGHGAFCPACDGGFGSVPYAEAVALATVEYLDDLARQGQDPYVTVEQVSYETAAMEIRESEKLAVLLREAAAREEEAIVSWQRDLATLAVRNEQDLKYWLATQAASEDPEIVAARQAFERAQQEVEQLMAFDR